MTPIPRVYVDASKKEVCCVMPDGTVHRQPTEGSPTTNQAEYQAVLFGLQKARDIQLGECFLISDSQLIINQLRGKYRCKNLVLKKLLLDVLRFIGAANYVRPSWAWMPREKNLAGRVLDGYKI